MSEVDKTLSWDSSHDRVLLAGAENLTISEEHVLREHNQPLNIVSACVSKTRSLGSPLFQSFFFRKERKLISVYPPVQASAVGLKVRTLSFLYNDFTDIIDSCELRFIRYLIKYNIYYRRETSVKKLEIKRTLPMR